MLCKPGGDILWSFARAPAINSEPLFRSSVFEIFSSTTDADAFRRLMCGSLFGVQTNELCTEALLRNGHLARLCVSWIEEEAKFLVSWSEPVNNSALTDRQRKIIQLMREDKTIIEIAKLQGITESTCQSHLAALRAKFGVKTNYGLIAIL